MSEEKILISHEGMPCDPPVVDGVEFTQIDPPLGVLWVGEATPAQAENMLLIPAFQVHTPGDASNGTGSPAGGDGAFPTDAEVEAMTKAMALEYAKVHFDGVQLVGNAQEVKDQVKGLIAQVKAQVEAQ